MKRAISIAALVAILGVVAYLNNRGGRTESWLEAPCRIVSRRVVARTVHTPPVFALYKGEYQLSYAVNGREFDIWADAIDWNEDRAFVERSISAPPQQCPYAVRYNAAQPSDAVASVKLR